MTGRSGLRENPGYKNAGSPSTTGAFSSPDRSWQIPAFRMSPRASGAEPSTQSRRPWDETTDYCGAKNETSQP